MTITVTFNPPLPSDDPATFNTKAFATLGDLNTWSSQANALAVEVNQDETALNTAVNAAQTSATTATTQAGIATTQAGNAASSASAALTSANNAAASFDAFDDRYLGAKASDPTLDNDGNALLTGALYWNTSSSVMRVYSGTAWNDVAQGTSTPTQLFSGTGAQTAFTLSGTPGSLGSLEVFISGVRQVPTTNYTVSGTTLTFVTAPPTGTNNVFVRWISTQPINVPADGSVTTAKLATLNPGVVISGSSTGDALRITQTGTGNALVVEDSTSPDSSPVVIDQNGLVVVGYTAALLGQNTAAPGLQLHSASPNTGTFGIFGYNATAGNAGAIAFNRSKSGTVGTDAAVASGDMLGQFRFAGYEGSAHVQAAAIRSEVDATPATGSMPGRLVFSTTPDGSSTPVERMRIDSKGQIAIRGGVVNGYVCNISGSMAGEGATTAVGCNISTTVQSDVTGNAVGYRTAISTQAATFTTTTLSHYIANQGTIGAGSVVTSQFGFNAASSLTGATNNYGFYSNIAAASGRWNFYANGTAANYFAGETTVNSGLTIGRTAVTAPAASDGNVFSGTYTPTLTNVTNVAASTALECQYMRVGNVVTVSGQLAIDPTATGAIVLRMSLPIASDFTLSRQAGGTFVATASTYNGGAIIADATNDTVALNGIANDATNLNYYFTFTYRVL